MKNFNNIAFRFWLAINLFFLSAILLLSSLFLWIETNNLEKALRDEGIAAANTLSSAISNYMLKEDYAYLSPLAYSLLDQPNVQYVTIRDQKGTVINQKGETITEADLITEKVPILYFSKYLGEIEIGLKTDTLKNKAIPYLPIPF